jgi:4-hydroxy-tetrahydrodipicolinate reductase
MPTRVAVVGATGRLGTQVCHVIESMPDMELVARLDSHSDLHDMLGADLCVDVTLPGVSSQVVEFAIAQGIKVLVGTSGWSADRLAALEKTLAATPEASVYIVPNFSLGATLQMMISKKVD